ncbi:MAG: response regulator [Oscillospiraceae bacterium]|nr:response regulator [Oscillospiraceae bacterium]
MLNKENLRSVSGLDFYGKIENMSEHQFNGYVQSLNSFIDEFTAAESKMRAAMKAQLSVPEITAEILNTARLLGKIHADDLTKQAHAVSTGASRVSRSELESQIENLILNVSSLSINIQMALRRGGGLSSSSSASPSSAPSPTSSYSVASNINAQERRPERPAVPRNTQNIPARPIMSGPSKSGRALILAVDNAVMFLNTLKKMLQDAPYDLHCVTSGSEALQFIRTSRPSLFLLDVEMPEMDGYTLARRIIDSGNRAPIIFITANSAREYVDRAFESGGSALLMKPLRLNQLLERIREFI